MKAPPATVDAFLADLPADQRDATAAVVTKIVKARVAAVRQRGVKESREP